MDTKNSLLSVAVAVGCILVTSFSVILHNKYVDNREGTTVVTCTSFGSQPIQIHVKGFRVEPYGFSGVDNNGVRQYFMRDANSTCWSVSEEEYNKARVQ